MQRSSYYYRQRADPQTELRMRLKDLAGARVRYGYRRLHILLMREGWQINHKRVYRLYKSEGLSLRLKTKKKRTSEPRVPQPVATSPNECWSMDFVADRLADGRAFRMLTLVDNFSRVSPAIEVDLSLTGKRVVEVLERLRLTHGIPRIIKVDNGSEFRVEGDRRVGASQQHPCSTSADRVSRPTMRSSRASTAGCDRSA